ncbi:MAG: hypothetical protein LUE90_08660 [Clostridiales bacterium]|nr:hypothetical protein [Clostridiales bacterium]
MKIKKWILSAFFVFVFVFAMTASFSFAEAANEGISYIDGNGTQQTYTGSYNIVSSSSSALTWGETGTETWYVVSSNVECSAGITVYGTVNLVVMKDCTLTVKNELNEYSTDDTLIIYGETATSGTIVAEGTSNYKAGIGKGGTVEINSGTVKATGGQYGAGIGGTGTVKINGGTVTAIGGSEGAGIGGGSSGQCGTVTINGGTVTATGNNGGAGIGIGGGSEVHSWGIYSRISINGGTVTANGSGDKRGIDVLSSDSINISGGYVTVTGVSNQNNSVINAGNTNSTWIVSITGGYFAESSDTTIGISGTGKVYGCDVASGYSVYANIDDTTKTAYPYVVMGTGQTFTVTWVDGNGEVLSTEAVGYGSTPTAYSGDTPTKTASGSEFYTFTGWDKELSAVTADTTYTAQFATSTVTATSGNSSYTSGTWTADEVTITLTDASQSVTEYQYSTDGGLTWISLDTVSGKAVLTVSDSTVGTDYLFRGITASDAGAPSNSFSVKIDQTAPVIGGIEDSSIYCEDVSFTVTEDNLDVVTVNGTTVTDYTLKADGLTYEIIAYDQVGNTAVCTVTVNSGHTEGEAASENEVAATCTENGSYDSVIYCTVCGEELSRETVTVSATGHSYTTEVVAPTYTEQGYTLHTCDICGDSYQTDATAILIIDGTDSSVSTQTTVQALTELPEGLKSLYSGVEELISDLISRVTVGTGYTADNALVYDVVLQYSTDGGITWITATVDNFPTTGITVTIPYPEGTDLSYEFVVEHMFTVTSERLGITAGDTERPTVTKTEDGLVVTLMGLSPVAVSWKAVTTSATEAETTDTSATSTISSQTGDNSSVALWLTLLSVSGAGAFGVAAYKKKRKYNR